MCPSLAEPVSGGFPRSNFRMFHTKHHIKIRQSWLQTTSRRQLKSFSVQQFFKNAAEVWASSPHLRSKSKLHHEIKQTSKKQSEESQLLLKSKGRNEIQGFRGNCDSQASWGCAPALPNRIQMVSLEAISKCFPFQFHKAGRSCSPPRKAFAFLTTPSVCQKHGTRISLPAGSDQGYSP